MTPTSPEALRSELLTQISALDSVARSHGSRVHHVKPHGALYHQAAADKDCAKLLSGVVQRFPDVALVAPAGASVHRAEWNGVRTIGEAFADRGYRPDGSLVPRGERGDLITDPGQAAEQAVSIAISHRVLATDRTWVSLTAETLCLHGDTPGADAIALAVRAALEGAGVRVVAPG